MRGKWILLVLMTALLLAACGRGNATEEASESTAAQPSAASAAAEAPQADAATATPEAPVEETAAADATEDAAPGADASMAAAGDFSPLGVLDSFRARGRWTSTGTTEDGATENMAGDYEYAFVKTDGPYGNNQFYRMTSVSPEGTTETMEIVQVDARLASGIDGEWITLMRDDEFAGLMTAENLLAMPPLTQEMFAGAVQVGDETVNGLSAVHYQIDDFDHLQTILLNGDEQSGDIVDATFDFWVVEDGGYLGKYEVTATIQGLLIEADEGGEKLGDETISWAYEIYEINEDVAIEWPVGAPEPGAIVVPGFADDEFPLPPETDVADNLFGMLMLDSALSATEVEDFYQAALSALGWTFEGDFGFFSATNGENTFNMSISGNETTGRTEIMVFGE